MFHGARFADLAARGRPLIGIGATEIAGGTPFIFTQDTFDLICSDLAQFPLARAVAASNGFPGLFSPITLTNHAEQCGGRQPGWLRRVPAAERADPLSRLGTQAAILERLLDPNRTRYVHLADGGISDNLGMRVVGNMMQNIAASPADIAAKGLDRIRRILVISVDGQGVQDNSVAQRRAVGGLFSVLGLVAGGQIDRFNFETLLTVDQQIWQVTEAIRAARCARGPVVFGTRCDDVTSELTQVSLNAMPPGPRRDELLAIPTGLTLNRHDVDALISAGQDAIASSQPIRSFLEFYPPHGA